MNARRAIGGVRRRLTSSPPPASISTDEHVRLHGGIWHDLGPVPDFDWGTAHQVGGPPLDLLAHFRPQSGPVGVLELDHARVDGRSGWVTTSQSRVLREHTFYGAEFDEGAQWLRLPRRTEDLAGLTVTLATDFASDNFAHGMIQVLPRLELVEAAGIPLDDVDHWIVNATGLVRTYVLELGIPEHKVVWTTADRQYRAERLVTTTFPGPRTGTCERSANFVRDRLGRPADGSGRRIHLPRFGRRRISNERELEVILHEHGFESIDPDTDPRDLRPIFAAAEAVVGAHGAALTNALFCPPGAHLFELVPTDQPVPFFVTIARSAGLHHRYLTGPSESLRPVADHTWGASFADFHVDPQEFETALRDMLDDLER